MTRRLKSEWIGLSLLIIGLCLYVPFRSISLDDFDGYSFALALSEFDLALQQPQPPGFPVYVGLARCLHRLTEDAVEALTWLSALSGAAAMLLVYAIGRQLDPGRPLTGLAAALWMGLTPLGWLTAEKALSDTAGLVGILLPLWLWARWHRKPEDLRWMAAAALTSGLALGVRPQNGLPVFLYLLYVLLAHSLPRQGWTLEKRDLPWLVAGALGLCGVLIWLVPTAWTVGGLATYVSQIREHAAHVGQADSLWSMSVPLVTALRYRLLAFGDTLLSSLVGVGLFTVGASAPASVAPLSLSGGVRLGALGLIIGVGLARADWRRRAAWGLALWTVAVAAQIFLYETLDRPRLMLPLLPPLALLTASGWVRVRRPRWLAPLVLAVTCLALLVQGVPLVAKIATVPSPPAQATAYVAARYPPEATLIAAAGSFRAVQVELPAYPLVYLYRFDTEAVEDTISGVRYVVIFDRDKFPPEAMAALSDDGRWVTLEDRTFVRDRRVHAQHDQVRVQVLAPASRVPAKALRLPDDGCIDLGGEDEGRYLGAGWFRPETIGGARGRWAGGSLTSTVRLVLAPDGGSGADHEERGGAYRLRGRVLAFPSNQVMRLQVADRTLAELSLPPAWTEFDVMLPAEAVTPTQVTTLVFVHARAESPFDATSGGSSDRRLLTAAYDWLCVETARETP
jgi:hypothetical protein